MLIKKNPSQLRYIKKIGVYIGVPGLGDLLFIIPLFRALKKQFPGARTVFIGKLLRDYVRPVFDNCPYIDDLLEFHLYESLSLSNFQKFSRALRREKFDLIVDTQRKFAPSMLLAMGRPRFMVSYSSNEIFSDFRVDVKGRNTRHTADISLDLVRALGMKDPAKELEITAPEDSRRYADGFLVGNGVAVEDRLAGLIPSAGHHSRNWNIGKFAQLADMLASELGCKLICFGSPADKAVIDELTGKISAPVIIEDFTRKSILDSAALMARCSVIVGVDSGPLHVADATGAPCVGIYGPTLPARFGLLGRNHREVCLFSDCAPCSDINCEHRKCLEDITPELVFNTVKDVLVIS
ncbi:MAG: glycosyltransferase family 9 protein [bacterium]